MKRLMPILTALVLSGCASDIAYSPPPTPSGASVAEVYVIRDRTYFSFLFEEDSKSTPWVVSLDERNLASLRIGEYISFTAEAGETHTIGVKRPDFWWHEQQTKMIFEPGNTYYFLAGVERPFGMYVRQLSKEQASSWIKVNSTGYSAL